VENAPEAIEWLARRGIMLNDITTTGGMSIDRTHRPRDGSAVGGYLISGLVRNITKRGIDVMLDTSVEEILMAHGEVSGVRLLNDEKESIEVQTKSIVMATGGFSANSAMVVKYRPDLAGLSPPTKGATGGGIALLERIGAGTVDMGEIQIHPTVEQKTSYLISESIRGGGAILVNQQGNRFFNEMETRDKVSAAIIALPEHYAYIVFDEHVRAKNKAADEYIAKGSSPAPARRANWRRNWGWITMPSSPRWNATTALLKISMMKSLAVPPRCARRLTKGRSMRFASRRGFTTLWAA
jgi:fumarate reductase flavoprotein subunit